MIEYPTDHEVLVCELEQFCENKNECDLPFVHKWRNYFEGMMDRIEKKAHSDGFVRYDPSCFFFSLKNLNHDWALHQKFGAQFKEIICATSTHGTTAGWLGRIFPEVSKEGQQDTKATFLDFYLEALEKSQPHIGVISFHNALLSAYLQLQSEKGFNDVLVHVYGKDEPVKTSKLLQARHRSIQMPDWPYVIIEKACTLWQKDGKLFSHDEVYAEYGRFGSNPLGGWCFGMEFDRQLVRNDIREGPALDLDVSGWDKSLHFELVLSSYLKTMHPNFPKIALNCAKGYNGMGIFKIAGEFYRLPDGATAWSSGCLNTLCGNSMIHSSLLQMMGVDHITMGDDANVFVRPILLGINWCQGQFDPTYYTKAGFKLKKAEEITGIDFCKRRVLNHQLTIDWDNIRQKVLAREISGFESKVKLLLPSIKYYNENFGVPVPTWALEE